MIRTRSGRLLGRDVDLVCADIASEDVLLARSCDDHLDLSDAHRRDGISGDPPAQLVNDPLDREEGEFTDDEAASAVQRRPKAGRDERRRAPYDPLTACDDDTGLKPRQRATKARCPSRQLRRHRPPNMHHARQRFAVTVALQLAELLDSPTLSTPFDFS